MTDRLIAPYGCCSRFRPSAFCLLLYEITGVGPVVVVSSSIEIQVVITFFYHRHNHHDFLSLLSPAFRGTRTSSSSFSLPSSGASPSFTTVQRLLLGIDLNSTSDGVPESSLSEKGYLEKDLMSSRIPSLSIFIESL